MKLGGGLERSDRIGDEMRTYEVMFIVRPEVLEEDLDKLIATMSGHATTAGATVQNVEKMGKRRLAYDVNKCQDGQYVLFTLSSDGKAIHELERRLRVTEQVLKFLTVRTDEEQQRLDKVKKHRAAHAKRAPAPPPAPADAPGAPQSETPAIIA